jgi:uncharacterized protein YpbB
MFMFNEFRRCYPQGSVISELIEIHEKSYIVKVLAKVEGITLISSFGSGETVEIAEDKARLRLFESLDLTKIVFDHGEIEVNKIPQKEILQSTPSQTLTLVDPLATKTEIKFDSVTSNLEISIADDKNKPKTEQTLFDLPSETNPIVEEETLKESSKVKSNKTKKDKKIKNNSEELLETNFVNSEIKDLSPTLELETVIIKEEIKSVEVTENVINLSEKKLDFGAILTKTDEELKRLGWTGEQGKKYLIETYGKRSRQVLDDNQLLEFLHYLQSLPSAIITPENEELESKSELETVTIKEEIKPVEVTENVINLPEKKLDFGEILAKTDEELKRLGWTGEQGKKYLIETYGKRSRQVLDDNQLLEFLHYLQSLPSAIITPENEELESKSELETVTITEEIKPVEVTENVINLPEKKLDFGEILAKTDEELKRLGWTGEQGKKYLIETYGKRSRQVLDDHQLLEFLHYLQSLPSAIITPENEELESKSELETVTITEEIKSVEVTENVINLSEKKLDFGEILAKTDEELKRLGWTGEQGKKYLIETYGKRSRQVLDDHQLLEFLHYLQSLPSAIITPENEELESKSELETVTIKEGIKSVEVTEDITENVTNDELSENLNLNLEFNTSSSVDFSDITAKINIEMKRLNWDKERRLDYILKTYGKRSVQLLGDPELIDFLQYLEKLPDSEKVDH